MGWSSLPQKAALCLEYHQALGASELWTQKPVLREGLHTFSLDLSIIRLLGFVPWVTGPRTDGAWGFEHTVCSSLYYSPPLPA